MAERVLVTGAAGFVGGHLLDFLLRHTDAEVHAARRRRAGASLPASSGRVRWVETDVTDPHNVLATVRDAMPTRVFHLAAQSFVPTSWRSPVETLTVNAIGTVNVLEAVRALPPGVRVLVAGSSEEYGRVEPGELPITEQNPLRPLSPYGVSKVCADLTACQYHRSYGLHVVVTRAFNHTGPGRGEAFAESSFCRQIAAIERGYQAPIVSVGNLEARRDFTDVRDIVRAYWLALERGAPGEVYNVCSGRAWGMNEVLAHLLGLAHHAGVRVECDPGRMRPSDVPVLLGDCGKFRQRTGWGPEIPLERTWRDLLDHWRTARQSRAMSGAACEESG